MSDWCKIPHGITCPAEGRGTGLVTTFKLPSGSSGLDAPSCTMARFELIRSDRAGCENWRTKWKDVVGALSEMRIGIRRMQGNIELIETSVLARRRLYGSAGGAASIYGSR